LMNKFLMYEFIKFSFCVSKSIILLIDEL